MNSPHSLASTLTYGRQLVDAGIAGIRRGQDSALNGQPLSALAADSARDSLKLAVAGACLGLLPTYILGRRRRCSTVLAFGALGSTVGFVAAFSWKTRKVASTLAHSAARELRRARDEHWLEMNPIDYA